MHATERAALLDGALHYDEMTAVINDRTLEILERRRKTATVRRRGWLVRRMLVLADVLGLTLAFLGAQLVFGGDQGRIHLWAEFLLLLGTLPIWVVVAKSHGLYERDEERTDHSTVDELGGVYQLVTLGAWLLFAGAWLTDLADPDLPKLTMFWALAILFVTLARASARAYCRRQITYLQNTVIVGADAVGQRVARKFLDHPEYGVNLVGFVDANPGELSSDLDHLSLVGPPERLTSLVRLFDIERVVIAFSAESQDKTLRLIRSLRDFDVQIDIVPRLFEIVGPNVGIHTVEGLPLVGLPPLRLARSSLLIKRTMDLVLSVLGLFALAPFLVAIALRIKLDSPGPVFYRHERVGKDGEPFRLFKFRTMRLESCRGADYGGDAAEAEFAELMTTPEVREEFERTQKLRNDPRVTRFGHFLRRTSLDEFPQLLNVVVGDISLVGPRAITAQEVNRLARHGGFAGYWEIEGVRPGVTGYWQINGRSGISWEERAQLEMAYVASWSLKLDFVILAKTLRVLLTKAGAY